MAESGDLGGKLHMRCPPIAGAAMHRFLLPTLISLSLFAGANPAFAGRAICWESKSCQTEVSDNRPALLRASTSQEPRLAPSGREGWSEEKELSHQMVRWIQAALSLIEE